MTFQYETIIFILKILGVLQGGDSVVDVIYIQNELLQGVINLVDSPVQVVDVSSDINPTQEGGEKGNQCRGTLKATALKFNAVNRSL